MQNKKENYHDKCYIVKLKKYIYTSSLKGLSDLAFDQFCLFLYFLYLAFRSLAWLRQKQQLEQQQEPPNSWIREL